MEPFTAAVWPPLTPAPTETIVSLLSAASVTATPLSEAALTSLPRRYAPVLLPRWLKAMARPSPFFP